VIAWQWWLVAALVLVIGLYLRSLAGRLDRLHLRLAAAAEALDAQLLRRAAAAAEVAHSGLLDPATSMVLADTARTAQVTGREHQREHEIVESELSSALRAALDEESLAELRTPSGGPGRDLLAELASAANRVVLARRFHNDIARSTLRLRRRRLVRGLRLAGTAPWPRPFEIDDAPPDGLV